MKNRDQLLTLLKEKKAYLCKRFGVLDLAVFGSFAKNEQKKESDVDICIRFKRDAKTFDNFMELRFFLEEVLDREVDLVTTDSIRQELKPKIFMEAVNV